MFENRKSYRFLTSVVARL